MAWDGPLEQVGPGRYEIDPSYRGLHGTLRMNAPGRIISSPELLAHVSDDQAPEQVANVASLPGIVGPSLAMPDVHWGYGFPIGGVAAFDAEEGIVSPGGVGFDINCGVRLLRFDLTLDQVEPQLDELADALGRTVPAGMGNRGRNRIKDQDLDAIVSEGAQWAIQEGWIPATTHLEDGGRLPIEDPGRLTQRARLRGLRGLGSLGSGNHFLEVQSAAEVLDPDAAKAYGVAENQVLVLIHSGSRGLGHQVCQEAVDGILAQGEQDIVDPQLAYTPISSSLGESYLDQMAQAANFAYVNRSLLQAQASEVFDQLFGVEAQVVWDVCHNMAKFETHTDPLTGDTREVLVHRKGATRAFDASRANRTDGFGDPVVVPGDMGRASYLLQAQAGASQETFGSSCHGAGRRMSRSQARREISSHERIASLEAQGIRVRATHPDLVSEEAPEAYKDVSQVIDAVQLANLASPVVRMRPHAVVKG